MPIRIRQFKKVDETVTYSISGVEIFSTGKWNGDEYDVNDLYAISSAFESLKIGFRPYLKLGHDNKQKLAKSSGLPSVGWVERVYVQGTKLLADFNYIPEKVFNLIKTKAYRKVSCEIYWNLDVEGNRYPRVLGAVALLGAENPGVMNLDDILGNYTFEWDNKAESIACFDNRDEYKQYSKETNLLEETMADDKTEKELQLEQELADSKKNYEALEADKKQAEEAKSALEKEIEQLKQFKLEAEQKALEAAEAAAQANRDKFVAELEGKKLLTPAMKSFVSQLLTDKKEYSIEEKQYSKEQVVEEILKLAQEASKINFEESTKAEFGKAKDETQEIEEKVQKYMKDMKEKGKDCTYVQAYKAVMKEQK